MKLGFRQRGSLLITSLFIAIVMLALGLALTRILQSSSHANAVEYYGSKSFLVAQSGIEWKLNQLFPLDISSPQVCDNSTPNFESTAFMQDCQFIEVTCSSVIGISDANSSSGTVNLYRLTSTASCNTGFGEWATERSVSVEAKTIQ